MESSLGCEASRQQRVAAAETASQMGSERLWFVLTLYNYSLDDGSAYYE